MHDVILGWYLVFQTVVSVTFSFWWSSKSFPDCLIKTMFFVSSFVGGLLIIQHFSLLTNIKVF